MSFIWEYLSGGAEIVEVVGGGFSYGIRSLYITWPNLENDNFEF